MSRIHKRGTRQPLKEALQSESLSVSTESDAFWADFKARAPLHPQHAVAPASHRHAARWALAAACTVLMMTGAGLWRWSLPVGLSSIDAFDIRVGHDAVFVMDDAASSSTLLWVVGMDETIEGGEG